MTDIVPTLLAGLLGLGTGIFLVLSLIEKPVWRLMWAPQSAQVSDEDARKVHAILKRVIHLLPPTMMTTMGTVSVLMCVLLWQAGFSAVAMTVAGLFFVQLVLIVARLFKDIRGVEAVPSDGELTAVRDGLGALALLHHRGLLMTLSTLIALLTALAFS
ncbi:hypothetical protein [Cognatiyoonia sp. IB215182]|uniref:hypothetical protein n=1 Tax=Cognatiyoonia sp. IB215182 TaxID=3097353 RepID=UPI002A118085|nr:hypothetical protein [Cognatiyoonia sp. IB215182]MDX8354108.1 hypothetical protein [Cognatiyoonia sp. IB215182]